MCLLHPEMNTTQELWSLMVFFHYCSFTESIHAQQQRKSVCVRNFAYFGLDHSFKTNCPNCFLFSSFSKNCFQFRGIHVSDLFNKSFVEFPLHTRSGSLTESTLYVSTQGTRSDLVTYKKASTPVDQRYLEA